MPTLNGKSLDILDENIKKLCQLFPEAECDGKIDFDMLRQILGEYVDDDKERYNFKWNGKGRALRFSQTPSTGTLRPCREESKNWDDTQNLYIEGDNLEVLKILQKSYHGKIKMIYIDPPYNTGKDFVYPDNYHDSIENYKAITGQTDEEGNKISTNTEASGRFHTDWLNMMYPRLRLARNLLTDDGVIFISIDDNEVDNLRKVCDEIFGEDNFVTHIIWEKRFTRSNNAKMFASLTDYILMYRKSSTLSILRESRNEKNDSIYTNPDSDPRGVWTSVSYVNPALKEQRPNLCYEIRNPITGKMIVHPTNAWKYEIATYEQHVKDNKLYWGKNGENQYPRLKKFLYEMDGGIVPANLWYRKDVDTTDSASKDLEALIGRGVFDFPKTIKLVCKMLDITTNKDDIILDFFSGSATTAHAVMQFNAEDGGNRRFICVQLPEPTQEDSEAFKAGYKNICEIGKERIRRAGEKIKEEIESDNVQLKIGEEPKSVPDIGFKVFKLDSSNLKKWNPDFANLEVTLDDMINNYVPDRTEEDIVYEFMLKMGLDLSYPIDVADIDGRTVYSIGFGALMMCLDDNITVSVAEGMVKMYKEQAPETWKVVFRDNGFVDDCTKTNVKLTLIQAGLEEDAFTTV